jgi:hypothetical protein
VAYAARTKAVCETKHGVEVGMSKSRGENREDSACGVRPLRWECAANRDNSEKSGFNS